MWNLTKILDVSLVILTRAAVAVEDGLCRFHFVSIRPRSRSEGLFPASVQRTDLKVAECLSKSVMQKILKSIFSPYVTRTECSTEGSRNIQFLWVL
jgi:hypothetical protein